MTSNEDQENFERDKIYGYWGVVKAFATIAAISVVSYKILVTPVDFKLDFPTLLSLLLAFFSVGLSALFYFKATESSNNFYDNTHKFTRDIAQLLAKMESGFGERLRHLDEGYSSVRDYLQTNSHSYSMDEAKNQIEIEKEQAKKTIEEREKIINDLLEKAHLEGEEKEKVISQLNDKEQELKDTRNEIEKLNRIRVREKLSYRNENGLRRNPSFRRFIKESIIREIGPNLIINGPVRLINSQLQNILEQMSPGIIKDLIENSVIDEEKDITRSGLSYLKSIAKEELE